jgi:hypothetical protein
MRNLKSKVIFMCLIGILFFSCANDHLPQKLAALSEINDPYHLMWAAQNHLFVIDSKDPLQIRASVYVYSLENYRLKKHFGGKEVFQMQPAHSIFLFMLPDKFAVNSSGKVSVFDYDYKLIKELEHQPDSFFYVPFGDKYVARHIYYENKVGYYRINLYDSELNLLKEFCRKEFAGRAFSGDFVYEIDDNKLYLANRTDDFLIEIFNEDGNKIHTIKHDYERVKVTQDDRDVHMNTLLSRPGWERYFKSKEEMETYYRNLIKYPEYFSALANIQLADNKIYVLTRRQVEDTREVFILDLKGKIIKQKMLPFKMRSSSIWNPMTIHNEHLYQLVKNNDSGEWELFRTKLL